jgi:hypothetical protein
MSKPKENGQKNRRDDRKGKQSESGLLKIVDDVAIKTHLISVTDQCKADQNKRREYERNDEIN